MIKFKHTRYSKNIKKLWSNPQANFICMGVTTFLILNAYPSVELRPTITPFRFPSVVEAAEKITFSQISMDNSRFKRVANFRLPESIKPHNISRHITKVQLDKKEYFLALASQAEGFRGGIYKDNEGWAIGNGWNLTKQSTEYNRALAQAVFSDKKTVDTIAYMSSQSQTPVTMEQMKAVEIRPQKALQVTYLIGEKIKSEYVIPGISQVIQKDKKIEKKLADTIAYKVFHNLQKNEQDTLIYHAYKCGGFSFVKFSNLINKIVDYSLKRKPVSKESIIAEFNYSYKVNGKKYLDKQAQELVGAMFMGSQQFAQVTNIKTLNFNTKGLKNNNVVMAQSSVKPKLLTVKKSITIVPKQVAKKVNTKKEKHINKNRFKIGFLI